MALKIAIQGGKASFHEIASHQYFDEEIEVVECRTFKKVGDMVAAGEVDYGLMAIENSIAGHILQNYTIIKERNLFVSGEIKLRIKQNLMVLPGQKIEDLHRISSHYMALRQCKEFLEPWDPTIELEEFYDTADAAKEIREKNLSGVGAIAGEMAAEVYDLEIIAESIETIKKNFTRFLVLQKENKAIHSKEVLNKATLSFELSHHVGALAKILQVIVDYKVNLTMIQSVPIIGKPDEYTFYVDCMWDNYQHWERCKAVLRNYVKHAQIIGEYKNWEIVYDNFSS